MPRLDQRGTRRLLTSPPTFIFTFDLRSSDSRCREVKNSLPVKSSPNFASISLIPTTPPLLRSARPHPNMAGQSINIPQVIVFAVVAFLVYRWYSSKPSANGLRQAPNRSTRINPAQIDTIAQMFPQLDRRDIAWDLQRNGGNSAATTERVLSGRSLDSVGPSSQSLRWDRILTFLRHQLRSSYLLHLHQPFLRGQLPLLRSLHTLI